MTDEEFYAAIVEQIRAAKDAATVRPFAEAIQAAAEEWRQTRDEPSSASACGGPCCGGM